MDTSKSRIEYMEEKLAHVEHDRSRPVTQDEVLRILDDLQSPEEAVRAAALREVCPCRMSWEIFEQVRKPALKLRKDPSPLVRSLADHIEEDAQEVAALEALRERELEKQDDLRDRDKHRKSRRGK